ncbi:MAG TPA: phosphotransferase [Candidatus Limnocylindrales bacterium]|nr:phosphotransferase [Candidatus Limnocylindrales bacterium]
MIPGTADPASPTAPDWVIGVLGEPLSGAARLPWGFTNETWSATTLAGDRYAVTRMASPATASFIVSAGPEIARRAGAVGLAMPVPIPSRSDPSRGIVVSRWLEGEPAMLLLRGGPEAAAVGQAMGRVWRQLGEVGVRGLRLDDTWARPMALATAAAGWLARVESSLDPSWAAAIRRLIDMAAVMPIPSRASFMHGDLVPANLLIGNGGNVLLDLEAARIGDPLADAAWFRWIVGYHHPDLEPAAWSAFTAEAKLTPEDPRSAALLKAYPVLRILEILAGPALSAADRDRWIAQLRGALR